MTIEITRDQLVGALRRLSDEELDALLGEVRPDQEKGGAALVRWLQTAERPEPGFWDGAQEEIRAARDEWPEE